MKLESNEYTIQSLIARLNKKFKKASGEKFNNSDISQYCIRGYIPYKYGGEVIEIKKESGIKIIVLHENKVK